MLLVLAAAAAADLPDIGTPLKTGQRSAADAAVVIGVEDYAFLPDVSFARRDAEAVYTLMVYTRGIPADRVSLLTDGASRERIVAEVKAKAAQVGPGGTLWVYFAGHGAASPTTSERLLLGLDTLPDTLSVDARGLAVSEVQSVGAAHGASVVLWTDACFTGRGRDGGYLLADKRSFVPSSAKAGTNVVQWDASTAGQASGPLPGASHGAFTYFSVGALRGWADGELDGKPDGKVTGEEASAYVTRAMRASGMRDQQPVMVGDGAAARVLMIGGKEGAPAFGAPQVAVEPQAEAQRSSFGQYTLSASDKLKQQQCDDDAKAKGQAARDTKVASAVKAAQAEATAAWAKLAPEVDACLKLSDLASRTDCAATVEAFTAEAGRLSVTLPLGTETVTTACGPRSPVFGAVTQVVSVAELSGARAAAAALRKAPTVAAAKVAPAPVSGAGGGSDWTSPTLGLMKWIPAGSFTMGSPGGEGDSDEHPAHRVTLTKGFYLMEHEVTQGEWRAVMGNNPSYFSKCGDECPVEQVSWDDAVAFAKKVSARDGVAYRLPTEAEWEYAARGGQSYAWAGSSEVGTVAWYDGNSGSTTHRVCTKAKTGYGLCDMSGNVWEWASDWHGAYRGTATDPTGPPSGSFRAGRGGSWDFGPAYARVANRSRLTPVNRWNYLGVRLAMSLP